MGDASTAPELTPPRSWLRRGLKACVWLLISLALLVVAAYLALQTDWGREQVRRLSLGALNDAIAGEFRVGRLVGDPLGTPTLLDVELLDPDGGTVFTIERVIVSLDVWSLVGQKVHIEALQVTGLSFNLRDAEGRVGIARAFAPPGPGVLGDWLIGGGEPESPWRVQIDAISVRDTLVLAGSLRSGGARVSVEDLTIGGALSQGPSGLRWKDLSVAGRVVGLSGPSSDEPLALASHGVMGDGFVVFESFEARLGEHRAKLSGRMVRADGEHEVDLRVASVSVDLPALASPLERGKVEVAGTIAGALGGAKVHLDVRSAGGSVELRGLAGLRPGGPVVDLDVSGRGLAPIKVSRRVTTPVQANLDGRVQLQGDPAGLGFLDAGLTLSGFRGVEGLPPVLETVLRVYRGNLEARVEQPPQMTLSVVGPLESPFSFDIAAQDVDLGVYARAAGIAGIGSEIHLFEGYGEVQLLGEGAVGLLLAADMVVENISIDGAEQRVNARALSGDVDFHYPGWGVPLGELNLSVDELDIAHGVGAAEQRRYADHVIAAIETAPGDAGTVALEGAVSGFTIQMPEGTIGEVVIPAAVKVSETDWRPVGKVSVKARDVDVATFRGSIINAAMTLRRAGHEVSEELLVSGSLKARRVGVGETVALGSASGTIRGRVSRRGGWSGRLKLDASTVDVADQLLNMAHVDLQAASMESASGSLSDALRLSGTVAGDTWRMRGTSVGAKRVFVTVEGLTLPLGGGFPRGEIAFDLTQAKALRPVGRLTGDVSLQRGGSITVKAMGRGGLVDRDLHLDVDLPIDGRSTTRLTVHELQLRDRRGDGFVVRGGVVELGRGRISTQGVTFKELGRGGGFSVAGVFRTGRGPIDLTLDGRSVDVRKWAGRFEDLIGVSIPLPGELAGLLDVRASARRRRGEFSGDATVKLSGGRYDVLKGVRGRVSAQLGDGWLIVDGVLHERQVADPLVFESVRVPVRVFSGRRWWSWGDLRKADGTVDVPSVELERFAAYLPEAMTAGGVRRALGGSLTVKAQKTLDARPTVRMTVRALEVRPGRGGRRLTKAALIARSDRTRFTLARGRTSLEQQLELDVGVDYGVTDAIATAVKGETPKGGWETYLEDRKGELLKARLTGELTTSGLLLGDLPFVPASLGSVRLQTFGRTSAPAPGRQDPQRAPLRLLGTVGAPRAEGWAIVERVPLANNLRGRIEMRFDGASQDRRAEVQVAIPQQVLASVKIALPPLVERLLSVGRATDVLKDPELDVEVFSEALAADSLGRLLPSLADTVNSLVPEGRTTFHARVRGTPQGPEIRADVRLERRQDTYVASLTRNVHLLGHVGPAGTRVYAMADQGPAGGMLLARAGLDVPSSAFLAFGDGWVDDLMRQPLTGGLASTDFRLDQLEHVLPSVFGRSRGWLDADVKLTGTAGDPILEGYSDVRFDEVEVKLIGKRSDGPFDVGLWFHDRMLELCRAAPRASAAPRAKGRCVPLEFDEGGGTMKIGLLMRLPKLDPAAMALAGRVHMKGFDLFESETLRLKADSDLSIGGTLARPIFTGTLDVHEARYVPDVGGSDVQTIGMPEDVRMLSSVRVGGPRMAERAGGTLAPLEFVGPFPVVVDVETRLPKGGVHVTNKFIDARPHGTIRARTDSDGTLRVKGRVWVNDGVFRPFDREFTFSEDSYVDFTGDPSVDPVLHIRAAYSIAGVDLSSIGKSVTPKSTITVAIDGKTGNIDGEPDLGNDLGMTKEQMMSIILLGTPGGLASGSADALSEAALSALGFSEKLREGFFFLDRISFVPTGDSVRLHVGKELGENLWGYYDFNSNAAQDDNQHVIRVEWRFSKGWRLETRVGDFQTGSLELLYRYTY